MSKSADSLFLFTVWWTIFIHNSYLKCYSGTWSNFRARTGNTIYHTSTAGINVNNKRGNGNRKCTRHLCSVTISYQLGRLHVHIGVITCAFVENYRKHFQTSLQLIISLKTTSCYTLEGFIFGTNCVRVLTLLMNNSLNLPSPNCI